MQDQWEGWPDGDKPDVKSWVLFAAGVAAIMFCVLVYVHTLSVDVPQVHQFTER